MQTQLLIDLCIRTGQAEPWCNCRQRVQLQLLLYMYATPVQLIQNCLHMLGQHHTRHALFTSFELLHFCCKRCCECVKERCLADAPGEWMHIRTTIAGVAPEVLQIMRGAFEGTQVEIVSYKAADMWAVGVLLALMLTGGKAFLDPDVTGTPSSSISDEVERMALAAKRQRWVCLWTAVCCAPECNVLHADM